MAQSGLKLSTYPRLALNPLAPHSCGANVGMHTASGSPVAVKHFHFLAVPRSDVWVSCGLHILSLKPVESVTCNHLLFILLPKYSTSCPESQFTDSGRICFQFCPLVPSEVASVE